MVRFDRLPCIYCRRCGESHFSTDSDLVVVVFSWFYFSAVSQVYSRVLGSLGCWLAPIIRIIKEVILLLMLTKSSYFAGLAFPGADYSFKKHKCVWEILFFSRSYALSSGVWLNMWQEAASFSGQSTSASTPDTLLQNLLLGVERPDLPLQGSAQNTHSLWVSWTSEQPCVPRGKKTEVNKNYTTQSHRENQYTINDKDMFIDISISADSNAINHANYPRQE